MRFALSFRPFVLYTCLTLSRFCPVPLSRSPNTINTTNVNNISPLFVAFFLSWDEGKDAAADAAIKAAIERNKNPQVCMCMSVRACVCLCVWFYILCKICVMFVYA